MAPPPPPPPPGAPTPPPLPGASQGFKIVPGLGDALHEAMRKISGVEEIAPAAEGVASDSIRQTSTPTGKDRPKSRYGAQVPGKPKISRPMMSEMEGLLAKRRDKVDKESYICEGPDPVPAPEPVSLPPSGARKPSTTSMDSGRGASLEPGQQRQMSLEPGGGYARVSVDRERKEELKMAKAVRQSSAKMLGRTSPNVFTPSPSPVTVRLDDTSPPLANQPPPSPVVMRYWKQCSSTADSGYFGEDGLDSEEIVKDANGDIIPPWKLEAIEGEENEFPSIATKIKQMEEEAKRPLAMYEVPDVKSKMNTGAPAAKWMEARGKLQLQLDTLITKTTKKIAKYGTVHARDKDDFTKDTSSENEFFDANDKVTRPPSPKEVVEVDKKVKTLIKTVANEIQKSFSMKSIHADEDEESDTEVGLEDDKESDEEKKLREEKERKDNAKNMMLEIKRRQRHIDVEAPILDFELKEPTPEPVPEDSELEDADHLSGELNFSAAKSKMDIRRKTSTERRLPASVLAKRKASEIAKTPKIDASTSTESPFTEIELIVAEKLRRKELFSDKVIQTQWDISNAEYELSRLSDNEKANLLTKQISKMKHNHVNKMLKALDTDVLDISLPLLIPFLSLQARMCLGVNLFKNRFAASNSEDKNKMVKETFIDTMIKDITDIALLQEVIERSQEKLLLLSAEDEKRFAEKLRKQRLVNIENDSFELGSSSLRRSSTPIIANSPRRSETPNIVHSPRRSETPSIEHYSRRSATPREVSPEIVVFPKTATVNSRDKSLSPVAKTDTESNSVEGDIVPEEVVDTSDNENGETVDNVVSEEKKRDDEGCPSSESDDDKEEDKSKDPKDEESDEGLGKSDDNATKVEEEPPKEKQIKQKIMNILQDAKAMDQKRSIRNFGRTFEFQGVKEQLRPVLPNDRRPQKAKRMDAMWMDVTAAKQVNSAPAVPTLEELKARKNAAKIVPSSAPAVPTLEELKARKNAAKIVPSQEEVTNKQKSTVSSVPWTRRGNAQPVSKEVLAAQKEVEEFESCRKVLQEKTKNETTVIKNTRTIQSVKKDEIVTVCKTAITEESKNNVVIESNRDTSKDITCDRVVVEETETSEVTKVNNMKDESLSNATPKECVSPVCITNTDSAVSLGENAEDKEENICSKKVSEINKTTKESSTTSSVSSDSDSDVEWEMSEEEEAPKIKEKTPDTVPVKEKTPEKCPTPPVISTEPVIPAKEISSLMFSPVVRRRGVVDVAAGNSVSVSASIRLPPPPSFRPPPPPMSPPVPVSKVKEIENKKLLVLKNDETSSEEEDESEWEYETESEEE